MSVKDIVRLLEQVGTRPREKATLAALDTFLPTAGAQDCGRVVRKAKDLVQSRKCRQ